MIEKKEIYTIQKASETLIEEKSWSTIDNKSQIHSWVELNIKYGDEWVTEFIVELNDELEEELKQNNQELWKLETYFDLTSKVEENLLDYFEKNNIISLDENCSWDSRQDSGYGVNYKRFYMNIIYTAELSEKQVKELEEMGYDVENKQ